MKSLYVRLVMTFVGIVFLSSLLGFFIANAYYQQNLKAFNEQKLTRIGADIVDLYQKKDTLGLNDFFQRIGGINYQIYLVDENGNGTFFGAPFRDPTIAPEHVQRVLAGGMYRGITEEKHGLMVTGFFENTLTNSIGLPIRADHKTYAMFLRPNTEGQFGEVQIMLTVLLIATFVLSILFILVFTRYLVWPIKKLTRATEKIAGGDYAIGLDISRKDEIGTLATHFEKMTTALKQLDEMRQEFVSNVSHEIQSPLTSIQGFTQAIRTGEVGGAQQEVYLGIIEEESRRLASLSKQLLVLASLEKETGLFEPKQYRLDEQIRQVVLLLEQQWREKQLNVEVHLPEIQIVADLSMLNLVWINLIANSIKFTEPHGTITVSIRADKMIVVTVADTGSGIAPEDVPHIFDRFYKGDKSRNRTASGSGLGLAISHKIIKRSGGEIEVQSEPGKGTVFTIKLPRHAQDH
ncbi:UNVERIFIED_CONTAM: signal transduction histidine kinase [Brevibacillus sp. OAP136]